MDEAIGKRKYRLQHAVAIKDTNTQAALVAAAVEEANISFHSLKGKEATKMRGRPSEARTAMKLSTILSTKLSGCES